MILHSVLFLGTLTKIYSMYPPCISNSIFLKKDYRYTIVMRLLFFLYLGLSNYANAVLHGVRVLNVIFNLV